MQIRIFSLPVSSSERSEEILTNIGWQGGGYQAQAIGRQDPQYIREQFQWKAYAPGLCRDIYFNF